MKTNTFFKNTLIILITSLVIKILGLLNKIFITRLLGQDGMELYVLTMPSVILLVSISSLSLNVVISKIISENQITRKYSPKKILKKAILLSLLSSFITSLILIIFIKPLTTYLLNNANLFFPILSITILLPFVGISDALRGYFNGIKSMKHSSISTLIEQIFRISSTIILLLLTIKYNIILSVSSTVICLAVGEISSIIYSIIEIKKLGIEDIPNTKGEVKEILDSAIPTTLSRLVSSFSHFLEPIIYTNILLFLLYDQEYIHESYTTITAYVIPFITLTSFVSNAVATSIIPGITESYASNNTKATNYYIDKSIIFTLIPGIFSCIIFYFYAEEYLNLLFNTTNGVELIKYSVFLMIPYYLQTPLTSILQSIGKSKLLFILTITLNITKLSLILLLSLIPFINVGSLITSLVIVIFFDTLIMYLFIKKYTKYKLNLDNWLSIFIVFIIIFLITYLFTILKINYIFSTIILLILTLIISNKLDLITIKSLKSIKNKQKSNS